MTEKYEDGEPTMKKKKNLIACACHIHLETDKDRKNPIPCLGHGKDCPCTAAKEKTE